MCFDTTQSVGRWSPEAAKETSTNQPQSQSNAFKRTASLVEPPPHVHSREDELFYVLEGEFDVYVGEEAFNVSTGECVFLPKVRPHALVIRSPRLRVLILYTPGGLKETFGKMSAPAQTLEPPTEALTDSRSDLEQTARRFGEHGVQILSPEGVAEQLPLYPKPLPRSGNADLLKRAG